MSKMQVYLTLHVTGLSDLGEAVDLSLRTPPIDYSVNPGSIARLAADAYRTAVFLIKGGTSHPTNPWGEEEEEPADFTAKVECQCGASAIFTNGVWCCGETGDAIGDCRDYVPF